jgi:hypothetical protein
MPDPIRAGSTCAIKTFLASFHCHKVATVQVVACSSVAVGLNYTSNLRAVFAKRPCVTLNRPAENVVPDYYWNVALSHLVLGHAVVPLLRLNYYAKKLG